MDLGQGHSRSRPMFAESLISTWNSTRPTVSNVSHLLLSLTTIVFHLFAENESLSSYDGQWLEMDDEKARLLSKEEMRKALNQGDFDLPTKSAYMLFYHRRT